MTTSNLDVHDALRRLDGAIDDARREAQHAEQVERARALVARGMPLRVAVALVQLEPEVES